MRIMKKVLSLILALCLMLSVLPAAVFAADSGYVYISVSHEGQFVNDKNGAPMAHVPVSFEKLAEIDLDTYGLTDYKYDADGDGTYEITALQLVIYAHEKLCGRSWSDVTFTGAPGSGYFEGGIFGFDENLNYYLNGQYPLAGEGWGATAENIVLKPGDCLDMASFSCWGFYSDPAFGFHYFADAEGGMTFAYTAEASSPCSIKLIRGAKDANYTSQFFDEPDYPISWGKTLFTADGTATTGSDGTASVTFPEAGTYYLWCDGGPGTDGTNEYGMGYHDYCGVAEPCIVSSPAYAVVTVTAAPEPEPEPEPDQAQDVSGVLNATMAKLASTVTAPSFGTSAGEWTVLSLARGGYNAKDNAYFTDYYSRILETVNETAASVNMSGALHKNKSTENSRLIVALSALGKDATAVGDWDLVKPYSENGISWIAKQGINGPTWALIALDSHNYATTDTTIRQQCVDRLLATQHDDGGWAGSLNLSYASDPDYTGMALQALYPYREQEAVAAACEEAFACLSDMQLETGGFSSDGAETAESAAQVIVACTTWGINPDTDSRFIKNGNSVVDALLAHYLPDSAQFQHSLGSGVNDMATDQACYALIAYDRFLNNKPSLYDFSDVTFDAPSGGEGGSTEGGTEESSSTQMNATLALPSQVENAAGTQFNATITIDKWDNEAGYKLVDFLMTIPEGLSVTDVTAGGRLAGGSVSYHLDAERNLRCVYFDANKNSTLTISGTEFPAEVFTVSFKLDQAVTADALRIAISGMSVKLSSDSADEGSMIVVNTAPVTNPDGGTTGGSGNVGVVTGVSFSAVELYAGDGVDLIPAGKKAVAVAVTGIDRYSTLVYNDGTNNIQFMYSNQITVKTNVPTFVALVDSTIATANFIKKDFFTINGTGVDASNIAFGDSNGDGTVNAQDALAVVDAWLRKSDAPTDSQILRMNVNGDSRINTFDALGIVEAYISSSTYGVVTRAATLATKS